MPLLDEQDLPFYLDKLVQADNAHLYLFSSLSLVSRRGAAATSELSGAPARGITPLLSLAIHPSMDVQMLPESFDVTIWGQLGNLFQKDVELLTMKRVILALFKELEELNARYLALIAVQPGSLFAAEGPLTLERRNYVQERPGVEGRQGLSLTQQYEHISRGERLDRMPADGSADRRGVCGFADTQPAPPQAGTGVKLGGQP